MLNLYPPKARRECRMHDISLTDNALLKIHWEYGQLQNVALGSLHFSGGVSWIHLRHEKLHPAHDMELNRWKQTGRDSFSSKFPFT